MESERTKKAATFLKAIAFCALFCLLFVTVTEILKDKRMEGEYNPTTKVRGFYKEPKDTIDSFFWAPARCMQISLLRCFTGIMV